MKPDNTLHFFSTEEGNLLIRILIAHIAADFVFQTNWMVENKKWFSWAILSHIAIVFGLTLALSGGIWGIPVLVAILHWLTDGAKVTLQEKYPEREAWWFSIDQTIHVLVIVIVWAWHSNILQTCLHAVAMPFMNYKISLLLVSYAFVIWPLGYFIKFSLPKIITATNTQANQTPAQVEEITRGGRIIGQFERIIILTFVLLGEYEAIGFLITGKSIIRFAQHNENLRSEYVLVGTMISFGLSIMTGEVVKWLLIIAT